MYRFILVGLVMISRDLLAFETNNFDTISDAELSHFPPIFVDYENPPEDVFQPPLLHHTIPDEELRAPSLLDSLGHPASRGLSVNHGFDDNEDEEEAGRLFFFQRRRVTVVLTKTSTSTKLTTCTLSTTACAGRRRRSSRKEVVKDGEAFENFSVAPATIQPIEVTVSAENVGQLPPSLDAVIPSDENQDDPMNSGRRADFVRSLYERLIHQGLESDEIQSSLKNIEENDEGQLLSVDDATSPRINLDSFRSVLGQLVHGVSRQGMPTLIRDGLGTRQFFPPFVRRPIVQYVVTWKTTFSVFTITSIPGCSVPGELNQCPTG